jgi:K+-sensing histidine kinase KdpD
MRFFTTIYTLLLAYIIAALVFWGYSLHKQSEQIFGLEVIHLRSQVDSTARAEEFTTEMEKKQQKRANRKKQYLGEGSTFLLVIFIGAAVVYSSFRRSIRLSRQQNNFMLSVTHELKSPIAAMKLNLQTLEKYKLDEDKKNLLLDKCIKESDRLNDLCNNMLLASQMEGRQHKTIKEHLDFSQMVESLIRDYSYRYPNRFEAIVESEGLMVSADKLMLNMALTNLLENAVKYSPAGTAIVVKLTQKGKYVCFEVLDQGHGIPDNEKTKIFRKFYRIGNEDTRKTKGTGLGLYLTKKIVKQHRGSITIKDNKPTGAIFELSLPLA